MLSAHSYFLAKTCFFRLQLKSLFLRENFPDFSIYQYFECMTLSPSVVFSFTAHTLTRITCIEHLPSA